MTERVFAYIDGFNLYFGLKSQNLRHLYWLNVPGAIRRLLERREQLEVTKYFTSRVSGPPGKVQRQNDYIDALASLPNVRLYFGSYQTHPRTCASCGAVWEQHSEKQTDVNIAVELLVDAHRDAFDTAVLVTADADLVPAVVALKQLFPTKRIVMMFPPGRGSVRLEQEAHGKRRLRPWVLQANQLPDTVIGLDGFPRSRPPEWR
ncbi:MAG: NYN domain-containing protein [Phycisphaerales bacterium]|nr:NYN domain-containing protein [Phycisphaerales bacterium]